ncbi:MAG: O-antigen ligase family protein [Alphaproteobacteria bacterium]
MPTDRRGRHVQPAALFWALIVVVVLAPLPFGSNHPWSWSLLALAIGGLLVAAAARALLAGHAEPDGWSRIAGPALLLAPILLWLAFQASGLGPASWWHPIWAATAGGFRTPPLAAISLDPEAGWTALMRLLTYAGVLALAVELGRRPGRARRSFWALAIAGGAYALYGLVIHLGGHGTIVGVPKWAYYGDLTSTFVNRNHYAAYAGLGVIVALALLVAEVKAIRRRAGAEGLRFLDRTSPALFLLIVILALLATALLWTRSRGALIATAVGAGAFLASLAWARAIGGRAGLATAAALAALAAGLAAFSGGLALDRFDRAGAEIEGRAALNALTIGAIAERPLLGGGLGAYPAIFQLHRGEAFGPHLPRHDQAHNSYLELAAEAGLPAALALFALIGWLLVRLIRGGRTDARSALYAAAGIGATALVAVHSLVDFSLHIPAVAATYFLILGLALSRAQPPAPVSAG